MKILIIDDEQRLLDALAAGFEFQWRDAQVLRASTAEQGLNVFFDTTPDVVVLDVGLPDRSGFDVLRDIRRVSDTPVVMLTAAGDELDQVKGLRAGADDYLVKPFSTLALMAHIEAVLRRAELPPPESAVPDFTAGEFTINFEAHTVRMADEPIKLTPFEYKLLFHLARNAGRLMPARALMERIWGSDSHTSEHQLQSLVYRLRAKIEQPGGPRYIDTERGLGYRFIRPNRTDGPAPPNAEGAAEISPEPPARTEQPRSSSQ
jgi:DNA-binding response OmpR family regulator